MLSLPRLETNVLRYLDLQKPNLAKPKDFFLNIAEFSDHHLFS
jgi:hypothetical protein